MAEQSRVVGQVGIDGVEIEVEFVGHPGDLAEYAATLGSASRVYVGRFPGRDDDGRHAITVVLPDADGVPRAHPY